MILENTPHEAASALAEFIKTVRLDQNMTRAELSLRVGASRATLTKLELQGEGSINTMVKVFAALGVLDSFIAMLAPGEGQLSLAELKKMDANHKRQRGRRKAYGLS
jgi:transcriptional regulator with XRE-family HTH domain